MSRFPLPRTLTAAALILATATPFVIMESDERESVAIPAAHIGDVIEYMLPIHPGSPTRTFTVTDVAHVADGFGNTREAIRIRAPDYLPLDDEADAHDTLDVDLATRNVIAVNATFPEASTGLPVGIRMHLPASHGSILLALPFASVHLMSKTFTHGDVRVIDVQGIAVEVTTAAEADGGIRVTFAWAMAHGRDPGTTAHRAHLVYAAGDPWPHRILLDDGVPFAERSAFVPGGGVAIEFPGDGPPRPRLVPEIALDHHPADGVGGPAFLLSRAAATARAHEAYAAYTAAHGNASLVAASYTPVPILTSPQGPNLSLPRWTLTYQASHVNASLELVVEDPVAEVASAPRVIGTRNSSVLATDVPHGLLDHHVTVGSAWTHAMNVGGRPPQTIAWTYALHEPGEALPDGPRLDPFRASWTVHHAEAIPGGGTYQTSTETSATTGEALFHRAIVFNGFVQGGTPS